MNIGGRGIDNLLHWTSHSKTHQVREAAKKVTILVAWTLREVVKNPCGLVRKRGRGMGQPPVRLKKKRCRKF